jgi:predicted Zn finger-like uncharacterized protein
MSLITRCPACTTIFKVVPDQLRVSDGWVRCGQCDEVFDANAYMQTALPLHVMGQTITEALPSQDSCVPGPLDVALQSKWVDATGDAIECEQEPPVSQPVVDALLAISPGLDDKLNFAPNPTDVGIVDAHEQPAFMRDMATPQAKNRGQRCVEWLWVVCAVLFAALFGFQWAVQERDRISASVPSARPLLASICAAAGCKISPMQNIDAVVIDSSAFSKLQNNVYQLSFSLKSTALVEIATPSLELTLTDMQDQPLIRRVFSPDELGRSNQNLLIGVEWAGSRTLVLNSSPNAAQIAGYRLLAFYP